MKSNKKNSKKTNKTNKSNKTVTPKSPKAKKAHVGRPRYEIKWPTGKFTFNKLMVLNEVDPATGKGPKCTKLTLYKGLKKDLARKSHSLIMRVKDLLADPSSGKLGRKQFVYIRRTQVEDKTPTVETVTPTVETPQADITTATDTTATDTTTETVETPTEDVSVNVGVSQATKDYEALKASLLAPTPVADVVETATETPAGDVTVTPAEIPAEAAPVNS